MLERPVGPTLFIIRRVPDDCGLFVDLPHGQSILTEMISAARRALSSYCSVPDHFHLRVALWCLHFFRHSVRAEISLTIGHSRLESSSELRGGSTGGIFRESAFRQWTSGRGLTCTSNVNIEKNFQSSYIINAYHACGLTKINGKVGSIIWRLGGSKSELQFSTDTHCTRTTSESETLLMLRYRKHSVQRSPMNGTLLYRCVRERR